MSIELGPTTSQMSRFAGNRDIWREILGYLEVDFNAQSAKEVAVRRRTLYSVALLAAEVSDLALDLLWKTMTTLQPLSQVINPACGVTSDGVPKESNIFYMQEAYQGATWVLRNPDDIEPRRTRLMDYLDRIRVMRLTRLDWQEVTLWPLLRAVIDHHHLLPRLKTLIIDFANFRPACPWATLLEPIITPLLETLHMYGPSPCEVERFEHVCSIVKLRCKDLTDVAYCGAPSKALVKICYGFKHLKFLKLNYERFIVERDDFALDIRLQDFPLLVELEIDVRTHPLFLLDPRASKDMENSENESETNTPRIFKNLKILHIICDDEDLQQLFVEARISSLPNLHSITISLDRLRRNEPFWSPLFSTFLEYPLKSFYLRSASRTQDWDTGDLISSACLVSGEDLAILQKVSIISFHLENIPHSLSKADLEQLTTSWPQIEELRINCAVGRSWFCPPTILNSLSSRLRSLRELVLPLYLRNLKEILLPTELSTNPLRYLTIITPMDHLQVSKDVILETLMIFFPQLESIIFSDDSDRRTPHIDQYTELQVWINGRKEKCSAELEGKIET